jgi:hypothetical protein
VVQVDLNHAITAQREAEGGSVTPLATIPLGGWIAEFEMIAMVAILTATLLLEDRGSQRRAGAPDPFHLDNLGQSTT